MSGDLSQHDINSKEAWDAYFKEGWERNHGREQTRLFARYFVDAVQLPQGVRTLLDVGCAMGDALPVFHQQYPQLKLFGCDVSPTSIEEARKSYLDIASFSVCDFDHIEGSYDVIYCSNTLEHFEDYQDIARKLLKHCNWLYILVPYRELRNGKPLTANPEQWHAVTFYKNSFDFLKRERLASKIRTYVRYTPGAWGDRPLPLIIKVKKFLKRKPLGQDYKQIFYEIQSGRS